MYGLYSILLVDLLLEFDSVVFLHVLMLCNFRKLDELIFLSIIFDIKAGQSVLILVAVKLILEVLNSLVRLYFN